MCGSSSREYKEMSSRTYKRGLLSEILLRQWWCPVCFYALGFAPEDYRICPCCGTEFGNDDLYVTHEQLRAEWISNGAPWFSTVTSRPQGWFLTKQQIDHVLSSRMKGAQSQGILGSDLGSQRSHSLPFVFCSGSTDQSLKGCCGPRYSVSGA